MRTAFIVSAVLHLSILAAAIIQFGSTKGFSTPAVAALPVELVTIDEETDLTVGEVDAEEVVEEAAPKTVEADAPPEPDEAPGATGQADETIATSEDARANAPESSAPAPEAEPTQSETEVAEPEPETAPPPPPPAEAEPETPPDQPAQTEVAAIDPQEATPPAAEPEPTPPAPQPETVVPSRKPPPPPRRTQRPQQQQQQAQEDSFNADRLSQLINRTDPTGGGSGSSQSSLGTADGRSAATLTLSEMDALRAQMQRCWTPPIGLAAAETLVVTVQIRLSIDGNVENIQRIGGGIGPLYDVAADAAQRAVLQCQPYRLPSAKYDAWKDVQVNFDPRDLF